MENTPNRFEMMDQAEEKAKQETAKNQYPKEPKNKIKIVISVLVCLVCAVIGYLATSGKLFPAKEKQFTDNGITFTLTNKFYEKEFMGFQVSYLSMDAIFAANREEESLVRSAGIYNLKGYIEAVLKLNGKTATINSDVANSGETFYYVEYKSVVDGETFSYLLVVFEGEDHYYAINYGCRIKHFDKYEAQFKKWAKTITVE